MNDTAAHFFIDLSAKAYAYPTHSIPGEHWCVAECYENMVKNEDLQNVIIVGEVFNEYKVGNIQHEINAVVGIERLYEAIYVWAADPHCHNNFIAQRFLDLASNLPTAQMVNYLLRVLAHQYFKLHLTALGYYLSVIVLDVKLRGHPQR